MSTTGLAIVALVMVVGLVGIVVPVLPGLLLIELAAVGWAVAHGEGLGRWVVLAVVTALLAAGTAAKYVLPSKSLRGAGAPRSTLLAGVVLAVIGFFVVPVVGLALGFVLGVLLAEMRRLHDWPAARSSTLLALKAIGIGMLVEGVAAVLAIGAWGLGVFALR